MSEKNVKLYAISTCAWCKKMKKLLDDNDVPYEGLDVDLLYGEEKAKARAEVAKHNPRITYPTVIIDDKEAVVGFDEDKLKEVLGL